VTLWVEQEGFSAGARRQARHVLADKRIKIAQAIRTRKCNDAAPVKRDARVTVEKLTLLGERVSAHEFGLALTLVELENNDSGNPGNRQTGKTKQADEEEFKSNKHVTILSLLMRESLEWNSAGRKGRNRR
jgi:hypothetical protein